MQGTIERLNEMTKNGKTFWLVKVNGKDYTCWDAVIKGIGEGSRIEFNETSKEYNGKTYFQIKNPKKISVPAPQSANGHDPKLNSMFLSYAKDICIAIISKEKEVEIGAVMANLSMLYQQMLDLSTLEPRSANPFDEDTEEDEGPF